MKSRGKESPSVIEFNLLKSTHKRNDEFFFLTTTNGWRCNLAISRSPLTRVTGVLDLIISSKYLPRTLIESGVLVDATVIIDTIECDGRDTCSAYAINVPCGKNSDTLTGMKLYK